MLYTIDIEFNKRRHGNMTQKHTKKKIKVYTNNMLLINLIISAFFGFNLHVFMHVIMNIH